MVQLNPATLLTYRSGTSVLESDMSKNYFNDFFFQWSSDYKPEFQDRIQLNNISIYFIYFYSYQKPSL